MTTSVVCFDSQHGQICNCVIGRWCVLDGEREVVPGEWRGTGDTGH